MKVVLSVVEGPHAGRVFKFDRHDTFIVGRAKTAQFRLSDDDEFFSRNHFLVEVNPPLCRILDLKSTNKTWVNGKEVKAADLRDGDLIRGGKTILQVSIERDSGTSDPVLPERVSDATIVPRHWPRDTGNTIGTSAQESVHAPKDSPNEGAPTFVPDARAGRSQDVKAPSPGNSLPSFPGYQTLRCIGRGGMGVVYEAESTSDRSRVAIKVVSPNAAATDSDLSRFIREAAILKDLNHPHIVRFRDLNQSGSALFIVMDFVAGSNAESILKASQEPMSVNRAVSWIIQLLDALKYAHERGYIHRDVKPANLLIAGQYPVEKVLLADFGLSRVYQSSKISGLTMTGEIGGSTPFMPPEQITNYRNVEPSADQYSAAATLYYLLTQKTVYDFPRDMAKQLLMILQDKPIPIDHRRPDLSASLVAAIHKSLSRDPSARFPNVAAFSASLQNG